MIRLVSKKELFCLLVFLNLCAVFAGTWYYREQLLATPHQLLPFVPDCPLFVLFALLIVLRLMKNDAFSFFVSCGMVKYGLWTVFVLLFHFEAYSLALPITLIFVIGHLGMALEGLALLPARRVGFGAFAITILLFLINDYADYTLGAVPPIPPQGMELVAVLTIAASLTIPLLLWKGAKSARRFPAVPFLRGIIFGN